MSIYPPVRIIGPDRLDRQTAQTPSAKRYAAFAPDLGIDTRMWGGVFVVNPATKTGTHRHGAQETLAYVLQGEGDVRWGERGECSATAHRGDFIHVPAWLPHVEFNRSHEHPFEWVVARSTAIPIVVNLPDDYWGA